MAHISEPITATEVERPVYDASVQRRPEITEATSWPLIKRVGFRFLAAYVLLYLFPFPLGSLPFMSRVSDWLTFWQQPLGRWTEVRLFGLAKPVPVAPTGSGDTMMDYAIQVDCVLLALVITLAWSWFDRRRPHYTRLSDWLRAYVRYGLATIMFSYGFSKVIPNQFPPPTPDRFIEPWGQFSPMGVLWSFMGYSPAYNFFTGMGEALGALLTAIRRTATLGALLLIAVMSNVAILNFTYDVPVKLFSTNLLLMAVFIACADYRRLLNVLVLNRAAARREGRPLFSARRWNMIAAGVGLAFVLFVMGQDLVTSIQRHAATKTAMRAPLYGAYVVEEFRRNGQVVPPANDSTTWSRVAFSLFDRMTIRLGNDSLVRYTAKADTVNHTMTVASRFGPELKAAFAYTSLDSVHVTFTGHFNSDSIAVRLRHINAAHIPLASRGYNWIQELPFNR